MRSVEFLMNSSLAIDVFNTSPSLQHQQEARQLQELFLMGSDLIIETSKWNPLSIGLLLKSWLQQLPEPLFTEEVALLISKFFLIPGDSTKIQLIRDALDQLPRDGFHVFHALLFISFQTHINTSVSDFSLKKWVKFLVTNVVLKQFSGTHSVETLQQMMNALIFSIQNCNDITPPYPYYGFTRRFSLFKRSEVHSNPVQVIHSTSDGSVVWTGDSGGTLIIWDAMNYAVRVSKTFPRAIASLFYSTAGETLIKADAFSSPRFKPILFCGTVSSTFFLNAFTGMVLDEFNFPSFCFSEGPEKTVWAGGKGSLRIFASNVSDFSFSHFVPMIISPSRSVNQGPDGYELKQEIVLDEKYSRSLVLTMELVKDEIWCGMSGGQILVFSKVSFPL